MDMLLHGDVQPGEKLEETSLCEQYGFSRTPLREALRSLESRGLLEYRANHGCYVRDLQPEEALHLYALREGVEGMGARLLAEHVTDSQVEELRELAEVIQTGGPGLKAADADLRFHTLIGEWSGNPFISDLVQSAKLLERTMILGQAYASSPPTEASDHRRIVDALAARDPDAAEKAMRDTIRDAAERSGRRTPGSD